LKKNVKKVSDLQAKMLQGLAMWRWVLAWSSRCQAMYGLAIDDARCRATWRVV
jgi:hypothetical protein